MGEEKRLAAWVTPSGAGVFVLMSGGCSKWTLLLISFCLFQASACPPASAHPQAGGLAAALSPGKGSARSVGGCSSCSARGHWWWFQRCCAILGSHPRASKRASLGVTVPSAQPGAQVSAQCPTHPHPRLCPPSGPRRGHMSDSPSGLAVAPFLSLEARDP